MSFTAQYRLVYATRHLPVIAALEAAIPDAAALVFACLGIALALHGRRALRARTLNLASVGTSVFMNVDRRRARLAEPGHLGDAPGRLRPGQRHPDRRRPRLGDRPPPAPGHGPGRRTRATPLAVLGGLVLWLLRLALAPASTLAGFRAWVAGGVPGRPRPPRPPRAPPPARPPGRGRTVPRKATKTGPVPGPGRPNGTGLSPRSRSTRVAAISADLAPRADLNPGAARAALRKAVLAARNGDPR